MLRLAVQIAFLLALFGLYWYVAGNLLTNMRRQDLRTDFGFLDQPAGFAVPDSDFDSRDPISSALLIGIKNTAIVSFVGILMATVLGVAIGIARLSHNWLVRRAAGAYVESLRNVPVLVVIVFFYTAVILQLPPIADASEWFGAVVVSNSGISVPSLRDAGNGGPFAVLVAAAAVAAIAVSWWRRRRFDRTGAPAFALRWALGTFVGIVVVSFVALAGPVESSLPKRTGRRVAGGIRLNPEYAALLVGLVAYTASHIAEIVRGAVLAVPKGQSEAATALGLRNSQRLRFIVLPQAFRIMIPPLANQYLNLTKNSSLAVAIGYPEITRITTIAIGQNAPAPQAFAVLMMIYLAFSLTISAVTNLINRRLRIATR